MPKKCPRCGSASSQKAAPAAIAAGRMEDPSFLAMLVVNETQVGEVSRAAAPNAPDRKCSSCGAGFRARLTRCPGCGSSRLARVIHKEHSLFSYDLARWLGVDDKKLDELVSLAVQDCLAGGLRGAKIPDGELVRARAKWHFWERGSGEVAAEVRRLLGRRSEAIEAWKALQAELGFVSLPRSGALNRPTLACGECPKMFRLRLVRCPECGSEEIARIQYGYPLRMPKEEEMVVLGGCRVGPYRWSCRGCGHEFGSWSPYR